MKHGTRLAIMLVSLILILQLAPRIVTAADLYENYSGSSEGVGSIRGNQWYSQIFTPSAGHIITSVKLHLGKADQDPYIITVSIKATDLSSEPTGADLASGTLDGSLVTGTLATREWVEISMGAGYVLEAESKYAIVVRQQGTDANQTLYWTLDTSAATYTDGATAYSTNAGSSWIPTTNTDAWFEEWGVTGAASVTTSAASLITSTTARINGNVTDIGTDNPSVSVYWGASDGDTTPASWDNLASPTSPSQPQGVAAFYKDVTGLSPGTTYYYRAKAANGSGIDGWSAATGNFTTLNELYLRLYVDDTPEDSAIMVAPIPDNANDWVWYPNPYITYIKLETGN